MLKNGILYINVKLHIFSKSLIILNKKLVLQFVDGIKFQITRELIERCYLVVVPNKISKKNIIRKKDLTDKETHPFLQIFYPMRT